MVFFALVSALCFVSTAAWGIADYPVNIPDPFCDCTTTDYNFGNGFDLDDTVGTASEGAGTIALTIKVNGIVGNAQWSPGVTVTCTDPNFCTDTDPLNGCGDCVQNPPATDPYWGNCDAPNDFGTTIDDEEYVVSITQGAFFARVKYWPAKGAPNVTVESGGVGVSPTYIAPTTTLQTFSLTITGLGATAFDFTKPWTIQVMASSISDGPGEDVASALIEPPDENPSLACTKEFDKSQVDPGDEITATVVITNTGDVTTKVDVEDILDNGLTYKAMVTGPDPTVAGQVLTWDSLGPLAPGENLTLKYVINVVAISLGDELCNYVTAEAIEWQEIVTNCYDCVGTVPKAPTFTQWGMIGFLLVLGASAVWLMRRRSSVS